MKLFLFILITLTTIGIKAQTIVFLEDFQAGLPKDWLIVKGDTNTATENLFAPAWVDTLDPDSTFLNNRVMASTSYFNHAAKANRWLITDTVQLGTFGNYLTWNAKSHDPSFPDDYIIRIAENTQDTTQFSDTLITVSFESFEWTKHHIQIPSKFDNKQITIAFINTTYDGYILYIDSVSLTKEDPASVQELNSENLLIYPNPTAYDLFIQFPNESISTIKLLNQQGQAFQVAYTTINNTLKCDLSQLDQGLYLVQIETNQGKYSKKIIKK